MSFDNTTNNIEVKERPRTEFKLPESYLTHDNGGTPFKVNISDESIGIYEYDKKDSTERLIKSTYFTGVFIGVDDDEDDEFSSGNSILVHVANNNYIHIGCEVFEFTTEETIRKYMSPIGNNDVPYPYAISDSYIYMMLSSIASRNERYSYWYADKVDCNLSNLYIQFYNATGRLSRDHSPFKEFEVKHL